MYYTAEFANNLMEKSNLSIKESPIDRYLLYISKQINTIVQTQTWGKKITNFHKIRHP